MTDRHPAPQPGVADPVRRASGAAWDLRAARAVPFALVCTLIAAAGHALGGGGQVALPALAFGFAAVWAVAALLGGRERSLASIAGVLGLGQLGLHLLFHSLCQQAMAGMTMDQVAGRLICNDLPGGKIGTIPAGMTAEQLLGNAGVDPSAYHAAAALPWWQFGLTPAMLAGHLVAAALAGWWLRRGEAALWRLVRLAGTLAREVQDRAAPLRTALLLVAALLRGLLGAGEGVLRAARPEAGSGRLPAAAVLRHSVIRRGPPAAAFAH
ncbi:putative membrane protein YhdT [Kitasatospora sp. MAP12-15]|uniref:hypothetical protein n=1 Tax=unclassified Kitasatospora TaxID=2633591 RepID=UPI002475CEF7|nr:hypothetical protein [Kitasatospora sp. MAP12-44]MDH6112087.1 putative membrane protein YhdT [Kitasatospora sp. MAP12-44]